MYNSKLPSHHQNLNEKFIKLILPVGKNSIYLGNFAAAVDKELLVELNINAVVSVCTEMNVKLDKNIDHLVLSISDTPTFNILLYIHQVNNFISQKLIQNKNVLIHCYMGKSRSATLMLGFLMEEKKINLQKAFELLKQIAPHCEPNPGFVRQLLLYEKALFGGISSQLQIFHTKYFQVQDQPGLKATQPAPVQISSPKVSPQNLMNVSCYNLMEKSKNSKDNEMKPQFLQNFFKRGSVPIAAFKQQSNYSGKEKNMCQSAQAQRSPVCIQKVNGSAISGNAFTTGQKQRLNTKIDTYSNKPELEKSTIITKPFAIQSTNRKPIICKN